MSTARFPWQGFTRKNSFRQTEPANHAPAATIITIPVLRGLDGLLQIVDIGWKENPGRPFVLTGESFEEVAAGSLVDGSKLLRVHEGVYRLQGRVIDVETGEIVVSVDLSQTTTRVIPEPRTISVTVGGTEPWR